MPDIRITRSDDGQFVWLNRNGSTWTFLSTDWEEFLRMARDFNVTGVKSMQNFVDLPTRTPLHANTPILKPKAILDDLI